MADHRTGETIKATNSHVFDNKDIVCEHRFSSCLDRIFGRHRAAHSKSTSVYRKNAIECNPVLSKIDKSASKNLVTNRIVVMIYACRLETQLPNA